MNLSIRVLVTGRQSGPIWNRQRGSQGVFIYPLSKRSEDLSAVFHKVDAKTNEIKPVKPLLDDISIEGGNALLTQRELADYIVEEKHAY